MQLFGSATTPKPRNRRSSGQPTRRALLVAALVAAAVSSPVLGQASKTLPRVVMISNGTEDAHRPFTERFLAGMAKLGHVEGRTFQFVLRAAGDPSRSAELIRTVVGERPDVLIVSGLTATRAARDATSTIPIVVATSSDRVIALPRRSCVEPPTGPRYAVVAPTRRASAMRFRGVTRR
jgi:putative ABC transport system substrate-binding protein